MNCVIRKYINKRVMLFLLMSLKEWQNKLLNRWKEQMPMKIINYDNDQFNEYKNNLKLIGSLSLLFSESDDQWLDYRVPENLYCECFNATNLARSCITADAKLNNIG